MRETSSGKFAVTLATACLCALSIGVVSAQANVGDLTKVACVAAGTPGSCSKDADAQFPGGIAVSPNGSNVYVGNITTNSVSVFRTSSSGALEKVQCVNNTGAGGCVNGRAVNTPLFLDVSPDGKTLYVSASTGGSGPGDNALSAFTIGRDGVLTFLGCFNSTGTNGCASVSNLKHPRDVVVSPDGMNVYVNSMDNDEIHSYRRDPVSGALTYKGCLGPTSADGCSPVTGLDDPWGLAVTPDGRNVYVGSSSGNAILWFFREASDGRLAHTPSGCIAANLLVPLKITDACSSIPSMGTATYGAKSVSVSPDGKHVYATASAASSVVSFARDTTLGTLNAETCFSVTGGDGCEGGVPVSGAIFLDSTSSNVYVGAYSSDAAITSFDTSSGGMKEGSCVADPTTVSTAACSSVTGLGQVADVAVSPDENFLYAASATSNQIQVFSIEKAAAAGPDDGDETAADTSVAADSTASSASDSSGGSTDSSTTLFSNSSSTDTTDINRPVAAFRKGGLCVKTSSSSKRARAKYRKCKKSERKRVRTAKYWKTLTGTVSDASPSSGIAKVQVKLSAKKGKKCLTLKSSRRLTKAKSCKASKLTWITASHGSISASGGTAKWTLKIRGITKKLKLTGLVRAIDKSGNIGAQKSVKATLKY